MARAIKKQIICGCVFFILLVSVYFLYMHGVNDAFYFDDHSNLSALGQNKEIRNYETLKAFVLGNASGPTGRPVSMLSFLLSDNSWPSRASYFKETNILIHLIIGCIIFWISNLLTAIQYNKQKIWLSLFVTAFWLISPLHISTVLYPVQRMAQLSALFSLIGILFYIKGRICLSKNNISQSFVLFVGLLFSFIFGVYSKENAAVLPLLIFSVEFAILRRNLILRNEAKYFIYSVLGVGVLCIVGYISYKVSINGFFTTYPSRTFSPYERVITQPYVLVYYLKEIFIPSLYTSALYYDDFKVFNSIFDSWKSFLGLITFVTITIIAFRGMRSAYLWGFALGFYLAAHIIESSVLSLELIFEHRNYLASAFLGFVWLAVFQVVSDKKITMFCLSGVTLLILSVVLFARLDLWRNEIEFGAVLSAKSPHSIRSHIELNNALLYEGKAQPAREMLSDAIDLNPDSVYLRMHKILVDCIMNQKEQADLDALLVLARKKSFDGRDRLAFEKMWQYMQQEKCEFLTPGYYASLIHAFFEGGKVGSDQGGASKRLLNIYADRFYILYPEHSPRELKPLGELLETQNPEFLMSTAASLASVNRFGEALFLAEKALKLLEKGYTGNSNKSIDVFKDNILDFIQTVEADIEEQKMLRGTVR